MSDQVFILFGALRSGTTLLRLMINGHPGLNSPGETDFLFDFIKEQPGEGWAYDWKPMEEHRIFRNSPATRPEGLDGRDACLEMIAQIGRSGQGAPILCIHRGLETALKLFPDAKVLHLIRDPRDVARSSIGMGWAGIPFFGVDHWIDTERDFDAARPLMDVPPLDLRYEDLIEHPEAKLTEIAEFFGLSFDPAMLDYDQGSSYSKPDPSLVYQWKRKQTEREVALTEWKLGDMLVSRGYAPSGYPSVSPSALDIRAMKIRNKSKTMRRTVKRFGVMNIAQRKLGKILHHDGMRLAAQARIDALTVKELK